jgi:hypothetical protein
MATLNMNATPETVWALLQEVAASQKETPANAPVAAVMPLLSLYSQYR